MTVRRQGRGGEGKRRIPRSNNRAVRGIRNNCRPTRTLFTLFSFVTSFSSRTRALQCWILSLGRRFSIFRRWMRGKISSTNDQLFWIERTNESFSTYLLFIYLFLLNCAKIIWKLLLITTKSLLSSRINDLDFFFFFFFFEKGLLKYYITVRESKKIIKFTRCECNKKDNTKKNFIFLN